MTILRPAFRSIAGHCRAGAIAFVCSDWRAAPHMLDAARSAFDEIKNWNIFVKTNVGMGTSTGHAQVMKTFELASKGKERSQELLFRQADRRDR